MQVGLGYTRDQLSLSLSGPSYEPVNNVSLSPWFLLQFLTRHSAVMDCDLEEYIEINLVLS